MKSGNLLRSRKLMPVNYKFSVRVSFTDCHFELFLLTRVSALPWETMDWMPPWLLTTDWSAPYSRSRTPSYYGIGHWFTVWSANSKRSSGVCYLETARGVSNAEVGNAHAWKAHGRRIADTHIHTYIQMYIYTEYSVFLVYTISVGLAQARPNQYQLARIWRELHIVNSSYYAHLAI